MSARRKRHEAHEDHENHERWLITYADMITLLMVLFIVLFAIGQTDLKKFERLKAGLSESFGGNGVLDGEGPLEGTTGGPVEAVAMPDLAPPAPDGAVSPAEHAIAAARDRVVATLAEVGLGDAVRFRREARGLVITIVTDQILFDLGSAGLRSEGRQVLDALADALGPLPNAIAVEGHTDDQPMRGGTFATNWELSTARATSVLRYLTETHGLTPGRFSAAGYADQRPTVPNDSDVNRRTNRRVEVVVLSATAQEGDLT